MAHNGLDVSHTMVNKRNRHKNYFKRPSNYLGGDGGGVATMERGHGRDSCDTSNILFLDLDGGSNLRQFSHLYTQDLCTLYVTLYEKKFFLKIIHDFISHFFCPQSHDYVKAYPALTEPTGGKLILLGLCTAAVISHHADRGSSATNFLREAIPGAANLATLMDSLFHQSVLFLSQHISQAGTICFTHVYLLLGHRDSASLVHCCIPSIRMPII